MSKGIGCQPFRDVLVVGGRATLVWAVGEEPRHKDGQGALVKGKGVVCLGSWALLGTVRSVNRCGEEEDDDDDDDRLCCSV